MALDFTTQRGNLTLRASINEGLTDDEGTMNRCLRRPTTLARLLAFTLAGGVLAGCGAPAAPARPVAGPPAQGYVALAERDTTSIRAIKKEIKKFFEVVTLDRVVSVKTLGIVPAPAWNEFIFEGTMVEDDLSTGFFTFRIAGIFDAVSKEVQVKTKELIDFAPVDPRAPRDSGNPLR